MGCSLETMDEEVKEQSWTQRITQLLQSLPVRGGWAHEGSPCSIHLVVFYECWLSDLIIQQVETESQH